MDMYQGAHVPRTQRCPGHRAAPVTPGSPAEPPLHLSATPARGRRLRESCGGGGGGGCCGPPEGWPGRGQGAPPAGPALRGVGRAQTAFADKGPRPEPAGQQRLRKAGGSTLTWTCRRRSRRWWGSWGWSARPRPSRQRPRTRTGPDRPTLRAQLRRWRRCCACAGPPAVCLQRAGRACARRGQRWGKGGGCGGAAAAAGARTEGRGEKRNQMKWQRVIGHWNGMPGGVLGCPSLAVF